MFSDFREFFLSVGRRWVGLVTGGAIVACVTLYRDSLGQNVTTGFNLASSVFFFGMAAFGAWRDVKGQSRLEREARATLEKENERLRNERPLRQIEKRDALDRFIADGHAIIENLKRGNGEPMPEFQRWVDEMNRFRKELKIAETEIIEEATNEMAGIDRVLVLITGSAGLPTEDAICAVAGTIAGIEKLREEIRD